MESILSLEKGYFFIGVFFAVSLLVIMAIMLDLWDGVYTAKRTGQRVHSHKLRVTIAKVSEYWRFLLIGFLADCLGFLFSFYFLPFMALLFGMGLIVVEIISMFEHAKRRKSHLIDLPEIIDGIIAATSKKDAEKIIGVISTKSEVSPHH
ncbi:phage holin family protein [Prevotella sp. MGM2]|uniref:phage holin family protein n=1 Tax=Prevotella sp. MGM2 TaxID=2033406 RepID=UPI000CEA189C|nr:phage holin family protein [Prevotella sp. MGM2]